MVERPRRGGDRLADLAQKWTSFQVFGTKTADEQQARRLRRANQVGEQDRAVDVAPLKVVDGQDQGPLLAQPPRAARAGAAKARRLQLLLVGHFRRLAARQRHGLDALQHRKDPRQKGHVRRQQARRVAGRQPLEMTRQGVDQAVERLVRHRFSFVTAPREHDGVVFLDQLVEERSNQRGLAGARAAEHKDRLGRAAAQRGKQPVQHLAMPRPPDQGKRAAELGDVGQFGHQAAQACDHITARRSLGRVSVEEGDAEAHQVFRQPLDERIGARGRLRLFGDEDLFRRAGEREPAGHRLVEHDPDTVPVAGGRDRLARRLLRRHVADRPDDLAVDRLLSCQALEVGRQAEIEQDDPPLGGHQDVGRLDVSVQLARLVERIDAFGELTQCVAKPRLVE